MTVSVSGYVYALSSCCVKCCKSTSYRIFNPIVTGINGKMACILLISSKMLLINVL